MTRADATIVIDLSSEAQRIANLLASAYEVLAYGTGGECEAIRKGAIAAIRSADLDLRRIEGGLLQLAEAPSQ